MRYLAVVFDLFGTLVDTFSLHAHEAVVTEMATALGLPRVAFAELWVERTWAQRVTGELSTVEANLSYICQALQLVPPASDVAAAASALLAFTRQALLPRPGACDVLAALRAAGYTIGLISDCSPAVPRLWPETSLAPLIDVPIFSCAVGLQKPDPRIYHLACVHLGVRPEQCLYVGDGSSHELSGARQVGMEALLLQSRYHDSYDAQRPDVDSWQGPTITALEEVLSLVGPGAAGHEQWDEPWS